MRDVYHWTPCRCGCRGWEVGQDDWYFWSDREPGSSGASLSTVHNDVHSALGPFGEWDMLELRAVTILRDKIAPVERLIETISGIFDERRRLEQAPTTKVERQGIRVV